MFELSAGQIVADKYRIDGVMGTGGMGVVVAATHVELDQRVAIKFLRVLSPEALARFQREARLLVRLKSPHVARVIDVGSLDDDTPYIVMEHLEGEDLSFLVANNKKLPIEETVDYILQASEAVAEAHALGMVHRDLKPANLFVARGAGGTTIVKVLDFGVSKILDDRSSGASDEPRGGDLTNEGVALGSPGYMSPEQMTSARDVDERSDIFSLGAMLFRLVTGRNAFKGTSPVSILASMAIDGLTPVRSIAPEVPESFANVIECCLAQDKAARYPTVAHLARALAPFATRRGRVSIEQIAATLNVRFDDEPLGDTMLQAVVAPQAAALASQRSGSGSAPLTMPSTTGPHLPSPSVQTGPQFPVPQSIPPSFTPARPATRPVSQVIAIGLTLVVLALFAGAAMFRALRGPQNLVDDPRAELVDPLSSASLVPVPVSVAIPAEPPPDTKAPPTSVAQTSSAALPEPPSVTPTAEPRAKPASTRARGHGGSSHAAPSSAPTATTTSTGPSPPPNPADVPGGRR